MDVDGRPDQHRVPRDARVDGFVRRCHDHKFDPIPTKDYYALAGIFLSTEPLYGTIKQKYSNSPTELLPIGPNAVALHAAAEAYKKKLPVVEKQLAAKRAELKKASKTVADVKTVNAKVAGLRAEVAAIAKRLAALKKNPPARPQYAMTVRDRAKPADTKIAVRGDIRDRGEVAPRGFLSAVRGGEFSQGQHETERSAGVGPVDYQSE